MSIPKLKVYRLQEDYNQEQDNDIQSMSGDELFPVSIKNLNPLTIQEMVGVKERRDSHMVVESNWKIIEFPISFNTTGSEIKTLSKQCDNWVLGKGNFRVFVYKKLKSEEESSSSSLEESSSSNEDLFDLCIQDNGWYEIDRKFWDYEIKVVKKYYYYETSSSSSSSSSSNKEELSVSADEIPYNNVTSFWTGKTILSIRNRNEINFKIGEMLKHYTSFFTEGYDEYVPIKGDRPDTDKYKIIVMYKTFRELNSSDKFISSENNCTLNEMHEISNNSTTINRSINEQYSKYRVPFGNIYNGNKIGRCFFTNEIDDDGNIITISSKDQNVTLNDKFMHYYQGNYLYKRKVFPLRYKVAQVSGYKSDFVSDAIISNGSFVIKGDTDWYLDGFVKPVLMYRQFFKEENGQEYYIFKQLEENLQYMLVVQESQENNETSINFKISFLSQFYKVNDVNYFPEQVFFFYNKVNDTLGNIFDFNYDYSKSIVKKVYDSATPDNYYYVSKINPWQNTILGDYGYSNRGNIILNDKYYKLFDDSKCIYKKVEKLAVVNQFGYNKDIDFQLIEYKENNRVLYLSFNIGDSESPTETNEKFVPSLGIRIYIDGKLIYDGFKLLNDNSSMESSSENEIQSDFIVEYDYSSPKCVIKSKYLNYDSSSSDSSSSDSSLSELDILFPKDLMVVFYEEHELGFANSSDSSSSSSENGEKKNPQFIGFRIPCYEKVKSSDLFVSSFPNWLKGHLNNDLDVFVGNTQYSGTSTGGTVGGKAIYPCYCESGWYAMYSQGAVQFAEQQEQYDYFDIFNYGTQMGSVVVEDDNDWDNIVKSVLPNNIYINTENTIDYSIYKIFYNKVKYNVAYYDGIYTVLRACLSNYSIQNKYCYALLQDDDYEESIGKKIIVRQDNTLRLLFQSQLAILPQKRTMQDELTTPLTEFDVDGSKCARIVTRNDRINVVNFKPAYETDNGTQAIIAINSNNTENIIINPFDGQLGLTDNDIRIHMKIEDYKLYIGMEHQNSCEILKENNVNINNYYCNCNGQASIDTINTTADLFDLKNIRWYCLPPLEDYYDQENLNCVQNDVQDIGQGIINNEEKILKRYKYTSKDYLYDVYFEVFSYRYSTTKDSNNKFPISSIEIIIYKIDKEQTE